MAYAKVETKKVERLVLDLEKSVVLTLTMPEAEALRAVTYRVGGPPSGTRGLIDNIGVALSAAGVKRSEAPVDYAGQQHCIFFTDGR
jgi:hypothetical protein